MKLRVTMHTGEEYEITVENYDPVELNDKRNNEMLSSILIGDYSLSRINIRDVVPLKAEEPIQKEAPTEEEEQQEDTPTETL